MPHPFQRLRPSNGSGTVSRETARQFLGVGDAELTALIRDREIPAPILSGFGERFYLSELSAYLAARRAARTA